MRKRIAQAKRAGETLPEEMAWVAETIHAVYQRRFKPFVLIVLAMRVFGIVQAPSLVALFITFVGMYFYIDFYSGVLHVVLDNPSFIRLPLIGVPCVEFQWLCQPIGLMLRAELRGTSSLCRVGPRAQRVFAPAMLRGGGIG
ncbi:MAG: hypothetical protein WCE62_12390 [Polyangiales bacterium]